MRLCVSIAEPTLERARDAMGRVLAAGARAEVRIDWLEDLGRDPVGRDPVGELERLVAGEGERVVLTFRRLADGGRREMGDGERLALLAETAARTGAWCDVEWDLAGALDALGVRRDRLVLSHHDFAGTPDLVALLARMTSIDAAVYKIATRATGVTDLFAHFELLERAKSQNLRLVPIAMGPQGVASRVLGPAWGAEWTFCSLDEGRESAPGQVSLERMRTLYRADAIGRETLVTGLVGGSVGYSRSPAMHNAMFVEHEIDGVYVPFEVDDLGTFLRGVAGPSRRVGWRVRGLSVTNPFKTEALRYVDRLDPVAERAGAANTILFDRERLVGFNTDVEGAMRPLERAMGDLVGARVGVVGAGGAARAVLCGLEARGAEAVVFARDVVRAREIGERFGVAVRPLAAVSDEPLDVLVNTTPVGTEGISEGETPVAADALGRVRLVYDLVYAPRRTRLLAEAERAGCATLGGLPMLATQAALQFALWTGREVDPERMLLAV